MDDGCGVCGAVRCHALFDTPHAMGGIYACLFCFLKTTTMVKYMTQNFF
jgi:hypothetical protein